jgi:hypothetical protein
VIRRTPASMLVMRRRMCRRGSLYWYLKRKPSEDISNTTSFVELGERPHGSGCRITTVRDERSKMKVVAAARAMARRSRRGAKGYVAAMEEERIVAVGHSKSPGVRTSIERWGAAMEEKSGMCVRLVAGNLRSGVFFWRRLGSIRYL